MLIFKSFFHKKTTKIYICLLSILFLILLLINSFRLYYSQLLQLEYDTNSSYFITINKDDISKVYDSEFIKNPVLGLNLLYNDGFYLFTGYSTSLNLNELIVQNDYFFNNNILIENKYSISDIYYDNIIDYDCVISYDLYQQLYSSSSEVTIKFSISNWKYIEILEQELKNIFEYDINFVYDYSEEFDYNLNNIIFYINIFMILLFLIVLATVIIVFINILWDDNKINRLYKYLGFSSYKVRFYNIFKLLLLFIISIFVSIISFVGLVFAINLFANFNLLFSFEILIFLCIYIFIFIFFYYIVELVKQFLSSNF